MARVKYRVPFNFTDRAGNVQRVGAGEQEVPDEIANSTYAQFFQEEVPEEVAAAYTPPYGTFGHHEVLFQRRAEGVKPSADAPPLIDPAATLAGRSDLYGHGHAGQFDHIRDSSTPVLRSNPPSDANGNVLPSGDVQTGARGEALPGSSPLLRGAPTTGFVEADPGEEAAAGLRSPARDQAEIDRQTESQAADHNGDEVVDPATGNTSRRTPRRPALPSPE